MAITALPSADGQELTIQIQGRFDFGAHQDFRDAYERVAITPRRYVVDLRNATYLDSSALGMLRPRRRRERADQPGELQPGSAQDPRHLQLRAVVQDQLR